MKKVILLAALNLLLVSCAGDPAKQLYKEKPGFYSYIIGDVKSDHIYKAHAADALLTPASCQKVVTSILALKSLGPDYQYQTKLYIDKNGNRLQNAVITFSGDPTFTSNDLQELLRPLAKKRIYGKLLLDVRTFKTPPHSPNIMIGDIGTSYAAPVYSALIDKNLINLTVTPYSLKKPALVKVNPPYKVNYNIITSEAATSLKAMWEKGEIEVTGNIHRDENPQDLKMSPQYIESYIIFDKVAKVLEQLNIRARIELLDHKRQLPKNLFLARQHESKPLKELLPPALKISDNLFFDSLYLTIINKEAENQIKDWAHGDKIYKKLLLEHFNLDFSTGFFVDGSGLSRFNRIEPRMLHALLRQGFLIPEFVKSLPQNGEDKSTLKERNLPLSVRAKTGSLYGISCLCGYDLNPKNLKAFVIMASNFCPPNKGINQMIDKFLSKQFVK